jgi:DNA-binding response OmpR family regulator
VAEERKPVILVVDDDPALQKLIVSLLRRGEMDSISAMDGYEARTALSQDTLPDLVLLDLMLPEISGIDLLKEFRSQPELEKLPIIILSAIADPEQIREGLHEGADRYLTKPYLANNLLNTVREVLTQGRRV